jgi:hypothetical protein
MINLNKYLTKNKETFEWEFSEIPEGEEYI